MASDDGADVENTDLILQMGKPLLQLFRQLLCQIQTLRMADPAPLVVFPATLRMLLHGVYRHLNGFVLAPYLIIGFDGALVVQPHDGQIFSTVAIAAVAPETRPVRRNWVISVEKN